MASKVYNDNGLKRGRLLSYGRGVGDMMNECYRNNWGEDNTILVVENTGNLNSKWRIYEGVKE